MTLAVKFCHLSDQKKSKVLNIKTHLMPVRAASFPRKAPDWGGMNVRESCFPPSGDVMTPLFGRTNSLFWKLSPCPEAQTNYLSTNDEGRERWEGIYPLCEKRKTISAFKVYKTPSSFLMYIQFTKPSSNGLQKAGACIWAWFDPPLFLFSSLTLIFDKIWYTLFSQGEILHGQ